MENFVKPIPTDLKNVIRQNYDSLIDFVVSTPFKALVDQLYELPIPDRATFVRNVLLDSEELKRRGVDVPTGILIQRSSFGDGRPTLFVVKKYLPKDYQVAWENVNLTFDIAHNLEEVRSGSDAWRKPIPWEVQAALYAMNLTSEDIKSIESS